MDGLPCILMSDQGDAINTSNESENIIAKSTKTTSGRPPNGNLPRKILENREDSILLLQGHRKANANRFNADASRLPPEMKEEREDVFE